VRGHPQYDALGVNLPARQEAYRALFRQLLAPAVLGEIREAVNRGTVTGTDRFKGQIEAALSRSVRPRKRGRPTKQVEENDASIERNQKLSFIEEQK
jgi:putative transposase